MPESGFPGLGQAFREDRVRGRTEMPRSESFGAFVFLRDKLRLAFAVISVPLRRDWCRVPCAAADGFRWVLRAVFILFAGVGIHLRPRAVCCSATWYTKKSF